VVNFLNNQGFTIVRAGVNYLTIVRPDTGERVRLKGNIFREQFRPQDLQRTSRRNDPAQLRALERRLERLVDKRASFHRARYGIKEHTLVASPIKEEPRYDRTRNASPQRLQTIGTTSAPARSIAGEYAGRFVEAAQRWSRADCEFELTGVRFEHASRAFANGFEPALTNATHHQRIVVSPYQYPIATPAARSLALHDHADDLEPEMEIDFP
jgi:hypothetical protein